MGAIKHIPQYTISDYRLWEGDWELIDGYPYSMSPSPKRKHQSLARRLTIQISDSIEKQKSNCSDCELFYELDWIIDDTTIVRPDIAIVCNQSDDFITSPPALIIEIISPATALKDRQVKFEIYKKQGVKFYLLADPETKTFITYSLVDGEYEVQKNVPSFVIHPGCDIKIDVEAALAGIV